MRLRVLCSCLRSSIVACFGGGVCVFCRVGRHILLVLEDPASRGPRISGLPLPSHSGINASICLHKLELPPPVPRTHITCLWCKNASTLTRRRQNLFVDTRCVTLSHSPLSPPPNIQAYVLLHSNVFAAILDLPGGSSRTCTVRVHPVPTAWRKGAATPEARSRQGWRWGERGRGRDRRGAGEVDGGIQR